jgi:hypothetical protein
MIQAVNRGRWYRPLYFNNLTQFWDKIDIVYIMHFSDYYHTIVRTVEMYGMAYIFTLLMFRKPNKTTINKNKTTNFYRSTSFRFSFIFKISTICLKNFRSGIIYVQNWRVCELLKFILAIQKQLTNQPLS